MNFKHKMCAPNGSNCSELIKQRLMTVQVLVAERSGRRQETSGGVGVRYDGISPQFCLLEPYDPGDVI